VNIVGVLLFAVFMVTIAVLADKLRRDRGSIWLWWVFVVMLVLSGVWFVDAFIYKFPNPFAGPQVEDAPDVSEPPLKPQPVDVSDVKHEDPLDAAQQEHEQKLQEWEAEPMK